MNADGSIVQEEVLATQEFVPIQAAADPEGTVIYMYNFYRCLLECHNVFLSMSNLGWCISRLSSMQFACCYNCCNFHYYFTMLSGCSS